MLRIDDDFVDRFLDSLPKQEVGIDDEGNVSPITQHWLGEMVDEVFEELDPSCERFCRLVKANIHLFQEYARKAGENAELTPHMQVSFMLELMSIFAYNVMKRAHEEALERLERGDDLLEE